MKKKLFLMMVTILSLTASVEELTDKNFATTIKNKNQTVVMFFAPWCGACCAMKPDYNATEKDFGDETKFTLLNTDENGKSTQKYKIESLPTTIVFENGKEIKRRVGSLDRDEIKMLVAPDKMVKEYTKKCKEGDAKICNGLGMLYREGEDVKQDLPKARAFYSMCCNEKEFIGCNDLALMYGNAEGGKRDATLAIKYYGMSCDGNESIGCFNLGGIYRYGWYGVEKKSSKALAFYDKACSLGDEEACYELSVMYEEGLGIEKDSKKSKELLKYACDEGFEEACDKIDSIK